MEDTVQDTFRVYVRGRVNTWFSEHQTYKASKKMFDRQSTRYDWVLINQYRGVKFLKTLDATPAVTTGAETKGTNYDHTGFCMSTFNTVVCYDCPCLKDCIKMMMQNNIKAIVEQMKEDHKDG